MTENNILSRQNTLWMQGVSALLIMLMHFVMQLESYPRFFNIFGSVAVAVFLFISGFGINESYKTHGINNFWKKRFLRVIIPCWTIFLFQLPFVEHFDSVQLLKNLTFYDSGLWFVDYIIRWYLVYWICRRFFTKNTKYILFVFGIYNVFQQQLYSEQAFSFFCGYLASEYIGKLNRLNKKHVLKYTCISALERGQQAGVAIATDKQRDMGIGRAKALIECGQLGFEGVPHDAQGQGTAIALLGQPGGHHAAPVFVQNFRTFFEKHRAGRGEGYAAGVAVEKLKVQLFFQCGNQPAQSRLGHEQVVCRLGKIETLCQHHETLQLI